MSRDKNCKIGKSCRSACISKLKHCRVELGQELSDDMVKARDSSPRVESRGKLPDEAKEQYQKDFVNHVDKNSAKYSNATFSPRDLANLLVQASNDLEGEAKENMKKLLQFVVKDDQVVFVSTLKETEKKRDIKTVKRFMELLEKSYPRLKLKYNFSIGQIIKLKEEQRVKTKEDRERKERGLPPIHSQRISGIQRELQMHGKTIKEARDKVFDAGVTRSDKEGNWGFTNGFSRRVVITDRSSIPANRWVDGERGDAKLVSQQMRDVMDFRASKPKLSDEEQLETKFIAGRFGEGKTNSAYAYVYVHELGHQVHYRSGEGFPPSDSVSKSRGSTLYSSNRGLSKYSEHSHQETFAEAFSAFIFNPEALREHDEPMYNWVKSSFETALQKAGTPLSAY